MEATKDIATKPAKPAKIKSNKKFTETEGFHAFVLFLPYGLLFFTFILLPIIIAIGLSFTYFDVINTPTFAGLNNYITLITGDEVFMKYVLPNTVLYAIVVGVGGYALSFLMAWILAQVTPRARTLYALAMSMACCKALRDGWEPSIGTKMFFMIHTPFYWNYFSSELLMRTPLMKGMTGLVSSCTGSRMPSKVVVSISFRRFV